MECPAGNRYDINITTFRHAPQEVKDYWGSDDGYILAERDLVYWFQYQGRYYAAQFIADLRLEFSALTGQLFATGEPF